MRVVVLGGTFFIGPAIVEELLGAGHEAIVVSRGLHRGLDLPEARERRCDRLDEPALAALLGELAPEVIVDTCAYTRRAAEILARARPRRARLVVLSSMDVYRAYGAALAGGASDAVPLDEDSPVRETRYPYRGRPDAAAVASLLPGVDVDAYDKLDVEDVARAAGASILRLPVVYGPRDPLRREEPILRRLRAGRRRIPIGAGNLLWTRGYVRDVARAARLAAERLEGGELLNVGERRTPTMAQWAETIVAAAGAGAELVRVADDRLPPDLALFAAAPQHLLVDSGRARQLLGWRWKETDAREAALASVRWHLAHPPSGPDGGFEADDDALS
jgi:nucleoside-diphosphate-sugar epimerase